MGAHATQSALSATPSEGIEILKGNKTQPSKTQPTAAKANKAKQHRQPAPWEQRHKKQVKQKQKRDIPLKKG
jgi:hypothetical protein